MPKPTNTPSVKVEVKKTVEITLIMDESVAAWLRDAMQNRLDSDESEHDAMMRSVLFHHLSHKLKESQ